MRTKHVLSDSKARAKLPCRMATATSEAGSSENPEGILRVTESLRGHMKKPLIIAEVKTKSPFGFVSKKSWEELFFLANKVGDMLSIHTDQRWGWSIDILKKARSMTSKPILANGIHSTDEEVDATFDAGCDHVLVVGRIPNFVKEKRAKIIIEPFSVAELRAFSLTDKILWNSRDLTNGGFKSETFDEARKVFSGWMCQASNIKTVDDIRPGANAVLVGEHLEQFSQSIPMIWKE